MTGRKYRFFYHYHKQLKKMSVHYRGKCHFVKDISCAVLAESKWNKRQPYIVMQGFAKHVDIENDIAFIYN